MSAPSSTPAVATNVSSLSTGTGSIKSVDTGEHQVAHGNVIFRSERMADDAPICKGYDFNQGMDYEKLFASLKYTGFQATCMGDAIEEINKMIKWRLSDEPLPEGETEADQPTDRTKVKCTIFLGYTSNMISSGVREIIRFLVQHKYVSAIVTTCGGIEEDFMKCMTHHYMGDFHLNGRDLRLRGLNRIGNLIVPNLNYCAFEEWMNPILDEMLELQQTKKKIWTPSTIIDKLGSKMQNEESVYYWAHKNKIPVFCPALTDGSIGDMIYFHGCTHKQYLIVDIAADIRKLNDIALLADKSGQVILGGGVIKHHICNANLMRNGADYSVYINTGIEYDGSDTGAAPDEAVSWGKIKLDARPVKVYGDASLIFPLVVSQTFARDFHEKKAEQK